MRTQHTQIHKPMHTHKHIHGDTSIGTNAHTHQKLIHTFIMDVILLVQCPILMNGILQCPNGATTRVFEDTGTFSCNAGYKLQGSSSITCLVNQSWSGGDPICMCSIKLSHITTA